MYRAKVRPLPWKTGQTNVINIINIINTFRLLVKIIKHFSLTVDTTQTVCPSLFCQQGAKPGGIQATQFEAPQTEGAVVEVQTQAAQQLYDRRNVSSLHAHGQRSAQLLLVSSTTDEELHQLDGSSSLTHLPTAPVSGHVGLVQKRCVVRKGFKSTVVAS